MKTREIKTQALRRFGTEKISISLPPILLQKARVEAQLGGFATLSGYFQDLLRRDSAPQVTQK